jgi:hypothetical protein
MDFKRIKGKIAHHISFRIFLGFILGSTIFFTLAIPIVIAAEHLIQRFTPQVSYFEYAAVKPAQPYFSVGETLRFNSFVEYKRDIDMRWEDTLYCYERGGWKKYTPQFWPVDQETQRKDKGLVNLEINEETGTLSPKTEDLEFWELFKHDPAPDATHCYVCGNAIGKTDKEYPKVQDFCTETFPVNQ